MPSQAQVSAQALSSINLVSPVVRRPNKSERPPASRARADFQRGPLSATRDSPSNLAAGFTVRDGAYLSARWPGDAHRFGHELAALLASPTTHAETKGATP